jgi:serralysin
VITYTLAGGADAAKFNINASTGALSFINAPNFESPTDVAPLNSYEVIVKASDGALFDTQTITVNVTNVNEAPVIFSNGGQPTAVVNVNENNTGVTQVMSFDPDIGATKFFSITGGADQNLFIIDSQTGWLSFKSPHSIHAPVDVGANGVYDVKVQVSDGLLVDAQDIAVTTTSYFTQPSPLQYYVSSVIDNGSSLNLSLSSYDAAAQVTSNRWYQWANNVVDIYNPLNFSILPNTTSAIANQSNTSLYFNASVNTTSGPKEYISDIFMIGGSANDTLINVNSVQEHYFGLGGNDSIVGSIYTDTLEGGLGADTMTGGSNYDIFTLKTQANGSIDSGVGAGLRDVITDFEAVDLIDLSGIDANTLIAGDQAFIFNNVASTVFTAASQLIFHYEGTGANEITVLQGNVNAGLTADFEVELLGHVIFSPNNINL